MLKVITNKTVLVSKVRSFWFILLILTDLTALVEKCNHISAMQLLVSLLLNAVALLITAYLVPGIQVDNFTTAILAAIVLGVANAVIKPILSLIAFPLTIITFGLFAFVINAVMLLLTDYFVPGLHVNGLIPALLGSIVLSIASTILNSLLKGLGK